MPCPLRCLYLTLHVFLCLMLIVFLFPPVSRRPRFHTCLLTLYIVCLYNNVLYLFTSFFPSSPPLPHHITHIHMSHHTTALCLIHGKLFSGGKRKIMAITQFAHQSQKEMTKIEEAQEKTHCEFYTCLFNTWVFLIKDAF